MGLNSGVIWVGGTKPTCKNNQEYEILEGSQGLSFGTPQQGGKHGFGQSGTCVQPPGANAASKASTMTSRGVGGNGGEAELLPTRVSKRQRMKQSESSSVGFGHWSKHAPFRRAMTL